MHRVFLIAVAVISLVVSAPAYAQRLTLTPAGQFPLDGNGWSIVNPVTDAPCTGAAGDVCTHFIFADTGGFANCVATTSGVPNEVSAGNVCNTLALAAAKLRANKPDWLLVNKGTVWQSATPATVSSGFNQIAIAGASCTNPMVISTYGTGARPKIMVANNDVANAGLKFGNTKFVSGSNVFISGFEFYGYQRDPSQPGNYVAATANLNPVGINWDVPPNCVTIENNKFSYLINQINVSFTGTTLFGDTFVMRRNQILNAFSPLNNGNGIFIGGINNLQSWENFYDTNGWNPILSAYTFPTYTNSVSTGVPAVLTWPSTVFFINASPPNNYEIQCTSAADGIPATTALYIRNLSGSTFNVSITPTGALLSTTANASSGSLQCYWPQPGYNNFDHNKYVHDIQPYKTLTPHVAYGDISINDSSGYQWRAGGPQINTLTALSGYGMQVESPMANSAAYQTNYNVMTELIAGGTPTGAGGRTGAGLTTSSNIYQFGTGCTDGTSSCIMAGDQTCVKFSNTNSSGFGLIPNAPINICYTSGQNGDPLTSIAIGAGLGAAINLDPNLSNVGATGTTTCPYSIASYGMCASMQTLSTPNGTYNNGTVGLLNFGPASGQVTITMTTTGSEVLTGLGSPGNQSALQIYNNLVFGFSNSTFGGQSNQAPQSAIQFSGNEFGADIQNNVFCNAGAPSVTNPSQQNVTAVASGTGGIVRLTTVGNQFIVAQGQGPVLITGGSLAGVHYGRNFDSSHVELLDVTFSGGMTASTISRSPYVTITPNVNNKLGNGTVTNDCATQLGFGGVVAETATGSITGTAMTFSATSGTVSIGQQVKGVGVTDGTYITAGSGSAWTVNISQTVASEPMQASKATFGAFLQAIGLGSQCTVANACTDQDFINLQSAQSKDNWNPMLRACVVNDWFRGLFGMTFAGCAT